MRHLTLSPLVLLLLAGAANAQTPGNTGCHFTGAGECLTPSSFDRSADADHLRYNDICTRHFRLVNGISTFDKGYEVCDRIASFFQARQQSQDIEFLDGYARKLLGDKQ